MTNLWHARLFPAFSSKKLSSLHAIKMVDAVTAGDVIEEGTGEYFSSKRLSMADIVAAKDVKGMLSEREDLKYTLKK